MRLIVFDQSPIPDGSTPAQALHNTVDLGRHASGLATSATGSPNTTPLACAAPEVLIGAVAAATEQIRVGSGGVAQAAGTARASVSDSA